MDSMFYVITAGINIEYITNSTVKYALFYSMSGSEMAGKFHCASIISNV